MDNKINMNNDDSDYSHEENGANRDPNISNIILLSRKTSETFKE